MSSSWHPRRDSRKSGYPSPHRAFPAASGLSREYLGRGSIDDELGTHQALKGKPVVIYDATSDPGISYREEAAREGVASILAVPIVVKKRIIGVLRLYSNVERDFPEDTIMLVKALAQAGGIAIQNASMYLMLQDDIQDMKEDMWSHRSWF